MGIVPWRIFPGNDHSIAWADDAVATYIRYGNLFNAIAQKVWALQSHIVTALGCGKVNAFLIPLSGESSTNAFQQALIFPVMMCGAVQNAQLNLTRVDRVWNGEHDAQHPLVRGTKRVHLRNTATNYTIDIMHPGVNAQWVPLLQTSSSSFILDVPLVEGAAIVRVRSYPS